MDNVNYQGYKYEEIQTILDVSVGSITSWKQDYKEYGICGLRLNYQGRKSYLSNEQREEVLSWLQAKDIWELGELEYKLAFEMMSFTNRTSPIYSSPSNTTS